MRKMKEILKIRSGVLLLCAVAAVAFALPTRARADEITLSGSTTGTFSASGTNTLLGMTFTGLSGSTGFYATTSGGVAALNLGSFSLSNTSGSYTGSFALNIAFTSPVMNSITDTATIFGSVTTPYTGGVWIFNFSPETINFGNNQSFELAVNSISVSPGSVGAPLTAFAYYTGPTGGNGGTVPEAPTAALAGLGIAGLFLLKKRLLLA